MFINNLLIREETPHDIAAIHALTIKAFTDLEISDHTEQFVIDALRSAGALTLSLVAELEGQVVGHTQVPTGGTIRRTAA